VQPRELHSPAMRLLDWNVHKGTRTRFGSEFARLTRNADVIVLQEMSTHGAGCGPQGAVPAISGRSYVMAHAIRYRDASPAARTARPPTQFDRKSMSSRAAFATFAPARCPAMVPITRRSNSPFASRERGALHRAATRGHDTKVSGLSGSRERHRLEFLLEALTSLVPEQLEVCRNHDS
jgi:hypothetical protein